MPAIVQPGPPEMPVPRATYRLQFNEHFRLPDALALVPYLEQLGISHVYASPLLKAVPHSTHGYDVCDFGELNPELGTEADLAELVSALRHRGMGLVLDLVPNHMGIGAPENHWWWDVLTWGPASPFAGYFDIDWESSDQQLRGKVLVPVLADRYELLLERGQLRIALHEGEFVLTCPDRIFPLTPPSLPASLAQLRDRPQPIDAGAAALMEKINSDPARLDDLIRRQHYLPACWQEADTKLNYRRFFNVNSLAGIRVEAERVFHGTHRLICDWIKQGWIDGLRVDHPDGLRDPGQYLHRLRGLAPHAWIVVEKITEAGEELPASWPVSGSTGYDFLNLVNGLFVDPDGEKPLDDFYAQFTGEPLVYASIAHEKKLRALNVMFAPEVNRLLNLLLRVAANHLGLRNQSREALREALVELAASLPVYRTYIRGGDAEVGEADVARLKAADAAVRKRRPDLDPKLFAFLTDLLQLRWRGNQESEFIARFQQLTAPVMAKGVEDTALYCFNRLLSLNEVGGDPGCFGLAVEQFHQACRRRQAAWPNSMLATSTHDTKRSEDVRARLNLLSEIPGRWSRAVRQWSKLNERHRRHDWPDRNAEYLFYQTLVGAWPLPAERALEYMEKAAHEARQHTGWAKRRVEAYDTALLSFVRAAMGDSQFMKELINFTAPLFPAGHLNSLAQTLVKLTAPGVPDIYQGCDLWDLSLVDPDNRRPVDFGLRRRMLAEAGTLPAEEIWQRRDTGLPKLWLIRKTLTLRRHRPDLFGGSSSYEPLQAHGTKARHAVAFMRNGSAITVVPRLVLGLNDDWADTTLDIPPGNWRNELTGEDAVAGPASLAGLLRKFPVALLARKDGG